MGIINKYKTIAIVLSMKSEVCHADSSHWNHREDLAGWKRSWHSRDECCIAVAPIWLQSREGQENGQYDIVVFGPDAFSLAGVDVESESALESIFLSRIGSRCHSHYKSVHSAALSWTMERPDPGCTVT